MSRFPIACLFVLLLAAAGQPASALTVTLEKVGGFEVSELRTLAEQAGNGSVLELAEPGSGPGAIPFFQTDRAVNVQVVAETKYSLTNAALEAEVLEHSWQAESVGTAQSRGRIYFSVDQNVAYAISGTYDHSNQGANASSMEFAARLSALDETTGKVDFDLFDNLQESSVAGNAAESFQIGNEEGNLNNTLSGAQVGVLTAGTLYELFYDAQIANSLAGTLGTASGSVAITFVPEPSPGVLVALGLVGMRAWRPHSRRNQRRQRGPSQ
jgi:hypothetical protein